jgi:hypothetical protein
MGGQRILSLPRIEYLQVSSVEEAAGPLQGDKIARVALAYGLNGRR